MTTGKENTNLLCVNLSSLIKILSSFFVILLINTFLFFVFIQPKPSNPQRPGLGGVSPTASSSKQALGYLAKENKNSSTKEVKGTEIKNTEGRAVYIGMWTQGFFDKNTNTLYPQVLHSLEQTTEKRFAIAHYYRGWEALDSPSLLSELNIIDANGWRPMVSVNPYFFDRCESRGLPLYKAIAQGNCDDFLHSAGKQLKVFGKTLFLRFAWEMNIPSMEWEIAKTRSTNQDFILAWQRMHNVIYSENATNVLWIFSPDVSNNSYKEIYPGDAFVDWIGLDGYNWGTTQAWSKWQGFSEIFSKAYNEITSVAPNKPLMLAEVNTTDKNGDKSAWYQDMLANQIPFNFPKINAVVFYNEDRQAQENVNWLIDVSTDSLKSFSENLKNPIYLSSF